MLRPHAPAYKMHSVSSVHCALKSSAKPKLRELKFFDLIILSRDWHPSDHISFCKNHPGRELFSTIQIQTFDPNENPTKYSQTLWPEHCVQNTIGAEYHPDLILKKSVMVFLL